MNRSSSTSLSPAAAAMTQINIAASAKKLDVNNRIPLRIYFRTADTVLRKADIFRLEDDIIDLYVTLLKFSSLAMETIPRHHEYKTALQSDKNYLKKKLLNVLSELEELKPVVQRRIEDLNRECLNQVNTWGYQPQDHYRKSSNIYPPAKQQSSAYAASQMSPYVAPQYNSEAIRSQQFPFVKPIEEQFCQINLNIPRPREETLARHSIFGPNGLRGQWQPPPSIIGVRYPSNIDFSPVNIPSAREDRAQKPPEDGNLMKNDEETHGSLKLEPLESEIKENRVHKVEEPASLISFETIENPVQTEVIRQPSPPPVLAEVQDLVPSTPAAEGGFGLDSSSPNDTVSVEAPLELHISTVLMDSFMRMAKSNTNKNLETCGVLAGSLKNRRFSVTALIIPKQESTSDSCQTTNEEEIFEVQDKQALFPLGWIHTHPTQSCFMSSIDVHTQYSYQIMLPEAIAIVMAPKDSSRTHGIFRLTTPGGMDVIRHCPKRGFHPHDPPSDGSPIYKQCTDVYIDPKLKFDIIDLR